MKTKLFILFITLLSVISTFADNNVITYTAKTKLKETTTPASAGLHTNAFNASIISHSFSEGVGTITFSNDVTIIGERAFGDCSDLTLINLPYSVTTIGRGAFQESGLTTITFPNSVTTIGAWSFYDCFKLSSITFGNSVTTIEEYAFFECVALTSITIPHSVTTIGERAFSFCKGLTSITFEAITPPSCGEHSFGECGDYDVDCNIPIYVPTQSISDYNKASGWKNFNNIQGLADDYYANIMCIVENGSVLGAGKYLKGETCTLQITADVGYHFTKWSDGTQDNPRTFVVQGDSTFIAILEKDCVHCTIINESPYGTISLTGEVVKNSNIYLQATAPECSQFIRWSDNNTDNPRSITVTQDSTFTAIFEKIQYKLSINLNDTEHGDIEAKEMNE